MCLKQKEQVVSRTRPSCSRGATQIRLSHKRVQTSFPYNGGEPTQHNQVANLFFATLSACASGVLLGASGHRLSPTGDSLEPVRAQPIPFMGFGKIYQFSGRK